MSSVSLLDDIGKYTRQFYKIFNDYFEILKPVIIEYFAKDVVRIEGKMEELQDSIVTQEIGSTIDERIECIKELHHQRLLAENIFNDFERPDLQSFNISNSNLTGTSHLAIVDAYEEMDRTYKKISEKMIKSLNDLSEEVAESLAKTIIEADNKVTAFEAIHKKTQNILLFDLYIFILMKIENINDEGLKQKICAQLEQDKTNILCHEEFKREKINEFMPLRRFGYTPCTDEMPLKELFTSMSLPKKSPAAVAAETKYSILVLNSVVYQPVKYNFSNLFKPCDLNKEYGITPEFIQRTRLVEYGDRHKYNFSYEYYDAGKPFGYIIETIDGLNYRLLSRGNIREPQDIENIVSYFHSPHKPTRVSCYQSHCINAALPNMMVDKAPNTAFYEITSKTIDAFYIQNQIILRLNSVMHTLLAEKKVRSNKDIIEIIHSRQFADEFSANLLDLYKIGAISNIHEFSGGQFSFAEILSTFIVKAEDLKRQFAKEMHDGYTRSKMIDFTDAEQVKEIPKIMEQLITSVVHLVIPSDENIYSVLNYKYMLMNHTEIV